MVGSRDHLVFAALYLAALVSIGIFTGRKNLGSVSS
jgi:hypothetical protein